MIDHLKTMLAGQFNAALCMVNQCIEACPPEHWEGKIANDSFRQVAYHTLFYADLYLSPGEAAFKPRDFHPKGGDERRPVVSPGLPKDLTLSYATICREKAAEIFAGETIQSLQGPSGFPWLPFTRFEGHLYNVRHIQHHAGALSAYLRRVDKALSDPKAIPWVRAGWR